MEGDLPVSAVPGPRVAQAGDVEPPEQHDLSVSGIGSYADELSRRRVVRWGALRPVGAAPGPRVTEGGGAVAPAEQQDLAVSGIVGHAHIAPRGRGVRGSALSPVGTSQVHVSRSQLEPWYPPNNTTWPPAES